MKEKGFSPARFTRDRRERREKNWKIGMMEY